MIIYEEETHTYRDKNKSVYISATDLVKEHKQPYDAQAAAVNYAKKNGQTPEHWLAVWEEKRIKSTHRGNKFHQEKEEQIKGRGVVKMNNQIVYAKNEHLCYESNPDLRVLEDGLYSELLVWDVGFKIAGQIDVCLIYTKDGVRFVDIDDHKTNERIDTVSYQFKGSGNYKMMLHPINHLMDCHFTHHALQISIYAFIMERQGYTIGKLTFTHYTEEEPPVVYLIPYLKQEVLSILNNRRKNEYRKSNQTK